jgi:hypothetical protein
VRRVWTILGLLAAPMMLGATAAQAATPTLSESPATVAAGGTVTISWSGVTNPTTTDWIGLYHPGDADTSNGHTSQPWIYDSSCTQTAGSAAKASGSCTYQIPATASGTYEFRLFSNDTWTKLATSGQITVSGSTLTETPMSATAGGSVTASWSGVANPSTTDWIGLYHPGDANTSNGRTGQPWVYDSSCTQTAGTSALASGSCALAVPPGASGTYELRLFANDGYTLLATSGQFTVTGGATLTVSPTSVAASGTVTVNWSGVANPSTTDWFGI